MECPKCGKRVKSTARYCEFCGKTLQGNTRPENNFEKYEEYRRERARRIKAKEKKQRAKKRRMKAIAVFLIFIAAICVAVYAGRKGAEEAKPVVKPSPSPTASAAPTQSAKPDNGRIAPKKRSTGVAAYDDVSEECDIFEKPDKGIEIPYPISMTETGESNDKTEKSIKTEDGDAAMIISAERIGPDETVNQLLSKYRSGIGVDVSDGEVDDEGEYYYLDFERGGVFRHRFGILKEGYHIYYDFSYNEDSDNIGTYREYIDYIDYYIKKSLNKKEAQNDENSENAAEDESDESSEEDNSDSE